MVEQTDKVTTSLLELLIAAKKWLVKIWKNTLEMLLIY